MTHVRVAICTWNRCELLRQTLESFGQLVVPADVTWELLVVNNNCTDATDAVVARFERVLPVRVVHEPTPGLSHARNRALADCEAEYLLFTDDDVRIGADWMAAFLHAAGRYPEAAAFGGPVEPWFVVPPDPDLFAAFPAIRNGFCGLDHRLPLGPLPASLQLTGANMGFRMSGISSLRFDPNLGMNPTSLAGSEETAFMAGIRARGGSVIWVPEMIVQHYVDPQRMEPAYLVRLARDRARSGARARGVPRGPLIAGAPRWLWVRFLSAFVKAAIVRLGGNRIRAAGHWAKSEAYRAKISEYRLLSRRSARDPGGPTRPTA
jgi:glucosyl-dolichyl phosphate glucuronosyltransferase